jgi:hypothetical protein
MTSSRKNGASSSNAATPRSQGKCRINLAISEKVKDQMESLKDMIGADTLTEVVRRALAVFETLVIEKKQGHRIEIHRKDKVTEFELS